MSLRKVSLSAFMETWHQLCPHIFSQKPASDLCQKCQMWASKVNNSGSKAKDVEKMGILEAYHSHVRKADLQRAQYRDQCERSKEFCTQVHTEGAEPCSLEATVHYSWDFTQQVFIPHHSQQIGPIYFSTPRKCEVFGVCCEGSESQIFYLADEGLAPGKGANTVLSYIHHYLGRYGFGETHAQFHFDNCSSQNKNNAVLWYALWREMTGLHRTIDYSLMIAGHTKFTPDFHFGVWKSRWRRINAETVQDVAKSVRDSSKNGHNIPHLVDDLNDAVQFYDWVSFFSQFFKKL